MGARGVGDGDVGFRSPLKSPTATQGGWRRGKLVGAGKPPSRSRRAAPRRCRRRGSRPRGRGRSRLEVADGDASGSSPTAKSVSRRSRRCRRRAGSRRRRSRLRDDDVRFGVAVELPRGDPKSGRDPAARSVGPVKVPPGPPSRIESVSEVISQTRHVRVRSLLKSSCRDHHGLPTRGVRRAVEAQRVRARRRGSPGRSQHPVAQHRDPSRALPLIDLSYPPGSPLPAVSVTLPPPAANHHPAAFILAPSSFDSIHLVRPRCNMLLGPAPRHLTRPGAS